MGLLGFGAIGQGVARRLSGFGTEVVYHRPSGPLAGWPGWVALEDLIASVDVLSLHLPYRPESRHLIGQGQIATMRPGAILINTSRGPLIDAAALIEALRGGRLGGAGLDVFEAEPHPPGSPLRDLPNTVLTPNVAGRSEDNLVRMVRHWAGNIRAHHAARALDPGDLLGSP